MVQDSRICNIELGVKVSVTSLDLKGQRRRTETEGTVWGKNPDRSCDLNQGYTQPMELEGERQEGKFATFILLTPASLLRVLPINQAQSKARRQGGSVYMILVSKFPGTQGRVEDGCKGRMEDIQNRWSCKKKKLNFYSIYSHHSFAHVRPTLLLSSANKKKNI